ncbi:c-type cytochrome [Acetobacter sp.]|uniref:c-type cytochrome n=1 Tax=Acetobacter sp. TaxID=440 RepID=UPI0039E9B34F
MLAGGCWVGTRAATAAEALSHPTTLDHTQSVYLSHCGGCHGVEGISGDSFVPTLRNAVGRFACTDEGRAYLIRVPGVSMSLIRSDQELADVMNFIMLRVAGTSLPQGFHPYTAAEIHEWRQKPLSVPDFSMLRGKVLERALAACARRDSEKP